MESQSPQILDWADLTDTGSTGVPWVAFTWLALVVGHAAFSRVAACCMLSPSSKVVMQCTFASRHAWLDFFSSALAQRCKAASSFFFLAFKSSSSRARNSGCLGLGWEAWD
jgi:hypothetical protein